MRRGARLHRSARHHLLVAKYDEPAMRHGYALAHAFIDDAFAGRL
jgi:hypothetical protein